MGNETDVDCLSDDPVLVLVCIREDISVSEQVHCSIMNLHCATADFLGCLRQIMSLVFSEPCLAGASILFRVNQVTLARIAVHTQSLEWSQTVLKMEETGNLFRQEANTFVSTIGLYISRFKALE